MYDILLKEISIVDGTAASAYIGDIGIKGDTITCVKPNIKEKSSCVIDGSGLTVVPGFIDIHRHGDLSPIYHNGEGEEIRQGITTFINGNCGFSPFPSTEENFSFLQDYALPILDHIPSGFMGMNISDYSKKISSYGLSSNMGSLVGNGTLRIAVKGFNPEPLTKTEMEKLKQMLRIQLNQGAFGLSMGLMYSAENYFTNAELYEIASVLNEYQRPIFTHMRGEGRSLLKSVDEVISIAKHTGVTLHISHLKAAGKNNWGQVEDALKHIACAKDQGISIEFDAYPYNAGSTAMYTLLPPRLQNGGMDAMIERLQGPERNEIIRELGTETKEWDNLVFSTGWSSVVVAGGYFEGKTIEEVAKLRKKTPEETCVDLVVESHGSVPIVFYSMSEQDVETVITNPESTVISDGLYSPEGTPHPRRYGAFAKAVHKYSDKIGFEKMIYKMTQRPAEQIGIKERGIIAEGYKADLVLLNRNTYKDKATYMIPKAFPEGIIYVILNGEFVVENSAYTGKKQGKFLTRISRGENSFGRY